MADRPEVPTHQWSIRTKQDPTQRIPVTAAYHNQEFDFIVFKDGQHHVCYTIAADEVLDIGRVNTERTRVVGEPLELTKASTFSIQPARVSVSVLRASASNTGR